MQNKRIVSSTYFAWTHGARGGESEEASVCMAFTAIFGDIMVVTQ
jgi:hypothetical protein